MSVSLVDPNIRHAHNDQIDQGNGSWIELGYPQDSKDQLILIGKGANGLEGLSDNLPEDQVVFAILLENSSLVQLLWCPDAISGVKKARAMVHARAVASQFDVSKSLPIGFFLNRSLDFFDNLSFNKARSERQPTYRTE